MSDAVDFALDDGAASAVRELWCRLAYAGVPVPRGEPRIRFAAAASIPVTARAALEAELGLLSLPEVWLANLSTITGPTDALVLAAVVDAELLAVHSAVHDVLAGRANGQAASYLPGSWVPHCALALDRAAEAFTLLHPVAPVRARLRPCAQRR
jgi:hypothetical protein